MSRSGPIPPKRSPRRTTSAKRVRRDERYPRTAGTHTAPGKSRPPGTLGERVYRDFKRDLIRGVYSPGESLGEKALSKRYRSSRTPVREAALRLQQEGLLRIIPNRGYIVAPVTVSWLNQIYEYRAAVESACAELAARRADDDALLQSLTRLARIGYERNGRASYERFIEHDTEFHVAIAQLTRNPLLVQTVKDMRSQMERVMYAAIDIGYYGEAPVREHNEILKAIRQRDGDRARQLMYNHIIGSLDKALRLAT